MLPSKKLKKRTKFERAVVKALLETANEIDNLSAGLERVETMSNTKVWMCGNCKTTVNDFHILPQHKDKTYCPFCGSQEWKCYSLGQAIAKVNSKSK